MADRTASDWFSVQGKVALITGASRGIGQATAHKLARGGAHIVIGYKRNQEAAEAVRAECEAFGVRALPVAADLEDGEQISALFETVRHEFGGLDILVANAAATANKLLMEAQDHHVRRTLDLSVLGYVRLAQAAAPLMEGRGGRIIAVSGVDVEHYIALHGVLAGAKAAMEVLTRYLACELAPRGISVNAVRPGSVDTDSMRMYAGERYAEFIAEKAAQTIKGCIATPEDIAAVIAFLCTAESNWICGQTITVDGGRALL